MLKVISVAIPGQLLPPLDYLPISDDVLPCVGARVWVSLRNKKVLAVVLAIKDIAPPEFQLKPILSIIDTQPLLSAKELSLMHWCADFYHVSVGQVIKVALPKILREGKSLKLPTEKYYRAVDLNNQQSLTLSGVKQKKVLSLLKQYEGVVGQSDLMGHSISNATINGLVKKGVLQAEERVKQPHHSEGKKPDFELNMQQFNAVETIISNLQNFHVYMLFGVTGSGKTEVYFEAIDRVLSLGKQILILLPEISLTPQFVTRTQNRFSVPIVFAHSRLSDGERATAWGWCHQSEAKILIGTRSSVLTSMPNLGLIVIDEEHDLSFKQQESPRYSSRDIAIKRAQVLNIPIILGSATPSLESFYNAQQKKYTLLSLDEKAVSKQPIHYQIVDLRSKYLNSGLSDVALSQIALKLEQGEQVLIFINRRGYAPILLCHDCGWMDNCPNCSVHLTMHARSNIMICHHCNFRKKIERVCKKCFSKDLCSVGVGTEQLESFLAERFRDYHVDRIDRDTIKTKGSLKEKLAAVDRKEVDILIGTQLLAKGHHFKSLNLVVVVDADSGLYSQDFRAIERLGQLLIQVSGRAGRESKGKVIIQTHQPDNPYLNCLIQKDYQAFCNILLQERQAASWPPFSFLALLRAESNKSERVYNFFIALKAKVLKFQFDCQILGPAPAPIEKKQGVYRQQMLLRAQSRAELHRLINHIEQICQHPENKVFAQRVKLTVDIEPQDLA